MVLRALVASVASRIQRARGELQLMRSADPRLGDPAFRQARRSGADDGLRLRVAKYDDQLLATQKAAAETVNAAEPGGSYADKARYTRTIGRLLVTALLANANAIGSGGGRTRRLKTCKWWRAQRRLSDASVRRRRCGRNTWILARRRKSRRMSISRNQLRRRGFGESRDIGRPRNAGRVKNWLRAEWPRRTRGRDDTALSTRSWLRTAEPA